MKRKFYTIALILVLLVAGNILFLPAAHAEGPNAIRPGFEDTTLYGNDDGSTGALPIGFPIDFFGNTYGNVYINNNGNLTFNSRLSSYTPFDLASAHIPIIAPYFADVDTRVGNPVRYQLWAMGNDMVDGHPAFGATWRDVRYYYASSDTGGTNSFQVILIDRSDTGPGNFDIEFNYDKITWEAGMASGANSDGLGGNSARVGYSNGTEADSYELPGSAVNGAFLDSNLQTGLINNSLNSDQLGRYVFHVRDGVVQTNTPPVAVVAPVSDAQIGLPVSMNVTPQTLNLDRLGKWVKAHVTDASATTPQVTQVTLDGSQSYDAENDPITYQWTLTGPNGDIPVNPVATPTVTLPAGTYTAKLVCNDGQADSDPATTTFTLTDQTWADVQQADAASFTLNGVAGSKSSYDADTGELVLSFDSQSVGATVSPGADINMVLAGTSNAIAQIDVIQNTAHNPAGNGKSGQKK